MSRKGPASKNAVNPRAFVLFLDDLSYYRVDGFPRRRRRYLAGRPVTRDHIRMLNRWWEGNIEAIAASSARKILDYYDLTPATFVDWCIRNNHQAILRGEL